jgi:excisionase family DNA binding protein
MTWGDSQAGWPDPQETPTLSVEETADLLGIGRTLGYELARRDELPCKTLRVGRLYRIPTLGLLKVLSGEPD